MTRPTSTGSSRSSSRLAGALLAAAAAVLALRPAAARACGYDAEEVAVDFTFDPRVLGDPAVAGVLYDPTVPGYGVPCDGDCQRRELVADWSPYLAGVDATEWARILFEADLPTIDRLILFLKGKQPAPAGWERSALARLPPGRRDAIVRALYLVGFARRVEPFGAGPEESGAARWARRKAQDGAAQELQRNGEKSFALAREPFLRQRYAFLLLRLRFYRQDWDGVVAFHKAQASVLDGPSESLRWRARHYVAGAHWRAKRYAEANLELARTVASAPRLAARAIGDFHPMEEADWQKTLALAATPQEKAWLWALVGVTQDGTAAMAEIAKIDPSSPWLPILAVREVNRHDEGSTAPLTALQRVCLDLAQRKGVDRPWVLEAVAGHAAAMRDDLPAARAALARATQRAPAQDALLRTQARASLALALAHAWRPGEAKLAEELVQVLPTGEGSLAAARTAVRHTLGTICVAKHLREDAELFAGLGTGDWRDPRYVQALIDRVGGARTPFERFMVEHASLDDLHLTLGRAHLFRGAFADAARAFAAAPEQPLRTDPFVMHVVDCHDCDHEKHANAPWTLRSYAERLDALERKAQGGDEAAARAAFDLGSGLYNATWSGNARIVFDDGRQSSPDTTAAERWFRAAYERTGDRELKAHAATMAAKCELARAPAPTVSKTWYPALRALAGTSYEKEVLAECGWYRDWKKGVAKAK